MFRSTVVQVGSDRVYSDSPVGRVEGSLADAFERGQSGQVVSTTVGIDARFPVAGSLLDKLRPPAQNRSVAAVPVRLPLPRVPESDSIFEDQAVVVGKSFGLPASSVEIHAGVS